MKTIANIYLIPNNNKCESELYIHRESTGKLRLMNSTVCNNNVEYLYITLLQSDLEISVIKEGDWFIRGNEIQQCYKIHESDIEFKTLKESVYCGVNTFWNKKDCEKIIAITNLQI